MKKLAVIACFAPFAVILALAVVACGFMLWQMAMTTRWRDVFAIAVVVIAIGTIAGLCVLGQDLVERGWWKK